MNPEKDKALFLHILRNEESPLEHASWTFLVEGISRVCSHQLVRHRIASYSQQSQRYVKQSDMYVIPQNISKEHVAIYEAQMQSALECYNKLLALGVKREDARYVLPSSWTTSIVITINLRSFCNLVRQRCNKHAQKEIRDLTTMLLTVVAATLPLELVTDFLDIMKEKANVSTL
jgi:thymidylate synthase (FAD)